MMMARRTAVLATCLLALAGAAAACSAGSFRMDLVSASHAAHPVAKCLSSVQVDVDAACTIALTAPGADGNFVPALWSSAAAEAYSYTQLQVCVTAGDAVAGQEGDPAANRAALEAAFSNHVYGPGMPIATTLAFASGTVTASVPADSATFVYAITELSGIDAADFGAAGGLQQLTAGGAAAAGLKEGREFGSDITARCNATEGRYGIILAAAIKACALCPGGSISDGYGCTPCAAGEATRTVGASSCTPCSAGTYAADGSSDCLPCPQHTYSRAHAAECTGCPLGAHAWVPGSTGCLKCAGGVPTCVAGAEGGTECTGSDVSPSPGYHVLSVGQLATCGLAGAFAVPAYEACSSWRQAQPSLQLSLHVAMDCSVTISPITDPSCSEPGNRIASAYTYANLAMHAYYQTTTTIRSLLPSAADSSGSSAFMLSLDPESGPDLTLRLWAATSKPADYGAATGAAVCAAPVTVQGGSVAGRTPAAGAAACPAGSYYDAVKRCPPCPTGYWCGGGVGDAATQTACTTNTYNALLGQPASGACHACPDAAYTSFDGATYCSVLSLSANCTDGQEWEPVGQTCNPCRAGTYRAQGSGTLECQECDAGTYSAAGATHCTACPAGQYSPTTGLPEETSGAIKCQVCPLGSLALREGQDTGIRALTTAATLCEACPAGTYTNASNALSVCLPCPAGTYRSGDATPENNACVQIPAGYYADANGSAATITPCPKGTFSYWINATARVPDRATLSTACQPCAANTHAPERGMTSCQPCEAGTYPTQSDPALQGPDQCTDCGPGTYRSYEMARATCAVCGAGSEVGPSDRRDCTPCHPGTYRNASSTSDFCEECPLNMYAPDAGAHACTWCPRGNETQEMGSSECTPCALGFYSAAASNQSEVPSCVAAPAGSYVNTTGAYAHKPCPPGSFGSQEAADACEYCSVGYFASQPGSTACTIVPAGYFASAVGAAAATPCPPGSFNKAEGSTGCDPCPSGQYANLAGSKSCRTCQAGTFSGGSASSCKSCQAGYYAPAGASSCSACKPGTYTSTVRSATCALCPKGKQCPSIATATPKDCAKGYYSAKEGARLCTACPINTYAPAAGSTQCLPCVNTSTRGLVGQSTCQAMRTWRRLL